MFNPLSVDRSRRGVAVAQPSPHLLATGAVLWSLLAGAGCASIQVAEQRDATLAAHSSERVQACRSHRNAQLVGAATTLGGIALTGYGVAESRSSNLDCESGTCAANAGDGARVLAAGFGATLLGSMIVGTHGRARTTLGCPELADTNPLSADLGCAQGNGESCFEAGRNYELATGVSYDPDRAGHLYLRSCELGYSRGCSVLAGACERGYLRACALHGVWEAAQP